MRDGTPRGPKVSDPVQDLLRNVMHEKRWHAVQLGEALGKHPDIVRRWLRGERRVQIEDVIAMADLLGISLDEVFGRAEPKAAGALGNVDELRAMIREEVADALLPLAPLVEIADLFLLSSEMKASQRLSAQRRDELMARDARHYLSRNSQESLRLAEQAEAEEARKRKSGL